ncbi:MAG: phosphoribosylformylglycinamidine synthase subunit PurL [Bacteroidia bacterium]|nr:phosphoribosylformylglycinamidine synthase subunit PurL [Bacteroidia bacterium]
MITVTAETAKQLGLSESEFSKICEILGRVPNFTELSIYSVMWSEHCSYKNSILQLKTLPKTGSRVLKGAGEENAGLMDIGDGLAVAFKIESHNHPSAIEPYQGAATGVGGIHRDIFSMGARPVAALNSLRFGNPDLPKTRHLLKGIVKGIGDYGNAFGVPTVGGEVYFDDCYNTNPLVNAMSVGIVPVGKTVSAIAAGVGNPVFIMGSATGTDGIHGATFASEDISEASEDKLPSVQVGDPFTEKILLEATLEAIETGVVVGLQDMGAAGITCSTSETAAKAELGMDVWLDKVPVRQKNMEDWQILLSESQERMLFILEKGKEEAVTKIWDKWEIPYAEIGVVTDSQMLRYYMDDKLVAEVPAESLVLGGGAPVYVREQKEPAYFEKIRKFQSKSISVPAKQQPVIEFLLQVPAIASKKWIYQQYDSMVGTDNNTTNAQSDAGVVRIKGTKKGLVVTTDCNSRYVYSNPETGCALAVAEAARNIVCAGGVPIGVTNCLNFGNPHNPEVYYQFAGAIRGMKLACEMFDTPVTGGNVSLYNQSEDGPVFPTPTIGMVGLIEDITTDRFTMALQQAGDFIYLIGKNVEDFGSSEYLYSYCKVKHSPAPYLNLTEEKALQECILGMRGTKLVKSVHDVSDGGLIISLLESAFAGNVGFDLHTSPDMRVDMALYGEGGGRAIVSVDASLNSEFQLYMQTCKMPFTPIGRVNGENVIVNGELIGTVGYLKSLYDNALANIMS